MNHRRQKKSPAEPQEANQAPRPTREEHPTVSSGESEAEPAALTDGEKKLQAAVEKFSTFWKGVDVRLEPLGVKLDMISGLVPSDAVEEIHRSPNFGVKLQPGFDKVNQGLANLGDMFRGTFGPGKFEINLPFLPARIVRSEDRE